MNKCFHCSRTMSASCCVFAITQIVQMHVVRLEHPRVAPRPDPSLCHEEGRDRPTQVRETRWSLSRSEQNTKTTNILWATPDHAGDTTVSLSSTTLQPFCSRVLPSIPTSFAVIGIRLKKSGSHSEINMLWKQSLMSVIPNQAPGITSGSTSNFEKRD